MNAPLSTAEPIQRGTVYGLFLLSAATLLFEIDLTRLFSVAQFYHFAFMIISLAMLGFGASGTLLALFPRLGRRRPQVTLTLLALTCGLTSVGAYALTNLLPFDSFSIAWDRRQALILALHYLVLATPFFCSGAALGLLFALRPQSVGRIYATNLAGSAAGCLLALLAPAWAGGEGVVLLGGLLGGLAALLLAGTIPEGRRYLRGAASVWMLGCLAALVRLPTPLALRLSPYKGLSYALQYPGARITYRSWNGFSRIDVVDSRGIRSLPGLSYLSLAPPPPQRGVFVDGDDLSPILQLSPTDLDQGSPALAFTGFLPTALAYQLRPGAEALILEPRGGLELWVALAQGAAHATAVEANPLLVTAADGIYAQPHVTAIVEDPRSYVRRVPTRYDVVTLALAAPYRPIRSGAYSLAEDYTHTVEAFRDDLACLKPDGLLVVTRWLQLPPSESLRAFALAVTAVEQSGGDPARQIAAFRGYATLTLLIKAAPFTPAELESIRRFADERAFDLVYAPDIRPEETNRYNILEEPVYYQAFTGLLQTTDRSAWYADYPFDVAPPTDDRPFFGHFFKGSQARQVMAELGKTWQPFGGAGYFVLLVLLALALGATAVIILLPLLVARRATPAPRADTPPPSRLVILAYFGLLGLGYLFVEIPMVQQFILFLGQPAYALTTVLFTLLLFSGIGSMASQRIPWRFALALLVMLALAYPPLLPVLFAGTLGLPSTGRLIVSVAILSPLGVLMGVPFPQGLRWLEARAPQHIPWSWGVNGATSVVASVLAALLALSCGFHWVLIVGALCYGGAWLIAVRAKGWTPDSPRPRR